jgi:hypothetical protein
MTTAHQHWNNPNRVHGKLDCCLPQLLWVFGSIIHRRCLLLVVSTSIKGSHADVAGMLAYAPAPSLPVT